MASRLASWSLGSSGPGWPPATGPGGTAAEHHAQVPVLGDLLQVAGEQFGEGDLVQVVVLAGLQPRLDRGGGLLGQLGKHVVGAQQGQGRGHDLGAGHLLGGHRPVVRHRDPRGGRPGVVEGELEQPGRGEPKRELTPERVHPRLVGDLPRGQGLLVVLRAVRRRDEHPHQQLTRLDRRVVAVLQQHGPLRRPGEEALPQLVIDNPFDLVELSPFHGGLHPRYPVNAVPRVTVPARNVSGLCWNVVVTTVRDGASPIGPVPPTQLARLLRLPEPTPEQAAVISAPLGPLAVIAGAGSGKSETMAARLVWLVANGMVRPDRVLGLTFTRKAAAEFADRVRSRLERLRRAGPLNRWRAAAPGEVAGSRGPVRRGSGDRHLSRLRGTAGQRQRPA